jgi:hypothetical protein
MENFRTLGDETLHPTSSVERLFSVSEAARRLDLSADSVRAYERLGIVTPQRSTGRRLYSSADIAAIAAYRQRRAARVLARHEGLLALHRQRIAELLGTQQG